MASRHEKYAQDICGKVSKEHRRRTAIARKALARASFALGGEFDVGTAEALRGALRQARGVDSFRFNFITDKVLIDYDAAQIRYESILAIISAIRNSTHVHSRRLNSSSRPAVPAESRDGLPYPDDDHGGSSP